MKITKEEKLTEIKNCINQKDSLYSISRKDAARFEDENMNKGKDIIPIMTYGESIIYLKAEHSTFPKIPLSKFNFTSGTFEKKWGPGHKTIVLTPSYSCIRKVEIEIKGMNIHKMRLLPNKKGDVFEDTAKIKITRHYRFLEGDFENKEDSISASPGEIEAR
jgi:hypothetical protein